MVAENTDRKTKYSNPVLILNDYVFVQRFYHVHNQVVGRFYCSLSKFMGRG